MRLNSVEVSEFQSIRNSNLFDIGDITCLVGKNESGKTAILQALYRLNPIIPEHGTFDVTDDYPRAEVEDYQQDREAGRRQPAEVIKATFQLSQEEGTRIESEYGKGILSQLTLTLCKGYDNKLRIHLPINERVAVQSIVELAQLPTDLAHESNTASDLKTLRSFADSKTDPDSAQHIVRLKSQLQKLPDTDRLVQTIYDNQLKKVTPKFLYFNEYFLMRGHENIEKLQQRKQQSKLQPPDYPLLGLIDLARLELKDLINPNRTEWLLNKLEGASNHLSRKILKYWSQNKNLLMRFDVRPARPGDPEEMTTGTNIWARIYDSKRLVSTPLGTRSRGFVWFFSFLAWFDQQQRENENLILLLDEPGLFLHGRAQADLLRYIEEELKGNHQVIYTTHSPFMVDPRKFERVRIVQDKSMDSDIPLPSSEDGTKVFTEVLEATEDSLFPLQGALGYDICQTLFIGPNNLVVEGVSDLLYLQAMSAILESSGREGLSDRWTITPVGGAEKVPTFVALLGSQKGIKIAALIDLHKGDAQNIENLYKRKLLKKQNVITFADLTGNNEADIEDMFGVEFYLQLVNQEYAKDLKEPIKSVAISHTTPRLLTRLAAFFQANPLKSGVKFSHYRPARYFVENTTDLVAKIPPKAIDRFESAFKSINALL
jgi:AAA15 family ATPase/GTPase